MKRAYVCDYCNFVGTRKEVKKHEEFCDKNPNAYPRMRDLARCFKCDKWERCNLVYENRCFVEKGADNE